MATLTPTDPRQLLKDAASATGNYSSVLPETFPDEVRQSDMDAWALDPREEEQDHTASDQHGAKYNRVPIIYIVYNVTSCGPQAADRSAARSRLDTLRDDYLTQVADTFANAGAGGQAQKTARQRNEIRNGENTLMVDAISYEVVQYQEFT